MLLVLFYLFLIELTIERDTIKNKGLYFISTTKNIITTSQQSSENVEKNWVKNLVFATFAITLGQNNLNYYLATDWCIMFHYERHIYKSNPTWLISISQYSSSPFLLTLNRDHIYYYGEVYK